MWAGKIVPTISATIECQYVFRCYVAFFFFLFNGFLYQIWNEINGVYGFERHWARGYIFIYLLHYDFTIYGFQGFTHVVLFSVFGFINSFGVFYVFCLFRCCFFESTKHLLRVFFFVMLIIPECISHTSLGYLLFKFTFFFGSNFIRMLIQVFYFIYFLPF